jgi:hypothetical protein
MARIERKSELEFLKWSEKGQEVDVIIVEEAVLGKANQFGGVDNYFRAVYTGTEDKVQINMPYDLLKKYEQVAESIVLGQTRFIIKFTGTRPIKGKAPMKLFDVDVEALRDE